MTKAPVSLRLDLEPWLAIHDTVMGGVSQGRMSRTDEGLCFSGTVSLENDGGFASVRRDLTLDLSGISAVRLRVRGDGRHYQCRLRTANLPNGAAWVAWFEAGQDWHEQVLPLADFTPRFRGRPIEAASPLDSSAIRQLGFLIADKRAGAFSLEIAAIEFVTTV